MTRVAIDAAAVGADADREEQSLLRRQEFLLGVQTDVLQGLLALR